MSAASMATARLMETWAHGQDVADALGVAAVGRPPGCGTSPTSASAPATSPSRQHGLPAARRAVPGRARPRRTAATWAWGPEDAAQRVTGPALDFCLLVTQRRHRADLALRGRGRRRRPVARHRPGLRRAAGTGPPAARERGVTAPLRIGNASGFYGDRLAAVREMLEGGPLDVLTGDYLAELTMLILGRDRAKDPARGYAAHLPAPDGGVPRARRSTGACGSSSTRAG